MKPVQSSSLAWVLLIGTVVAVTVVIGNNTFGLAHPWDYYAIGAALAVLAVTLVIWALRPHGTHTIGADRLCYEHMVMGRSPLTYSMSTKWTDGCLVLMAVGIIIGFFQEMYDTSLDAVSAVDFWSVTHFLFGCALFVGIYVITRSSPKAVWVTITILGLYEVVEAVILPLAGVSAEFYAETIGNIVFDIFIGSVGVVVGYLCTKTDPCRVPVVTGSPSGKRRAKMRRCRVGDGSARCSADPRKTQF